LQERLANYPVKEKFVAKPMILNVVLK